MRIVHKVCHYLRYGEGLARGLRSEELQEYKKCKQCKRDKEGIPGCLMGAEEMVSIVKHGQPWGKKYRLSRKSWPDSTRYTGSGKVK